MMTANELYRLTQNKNAIFYDVVITEVATEFVKCDVLNKKLTLPKVRYKTLTNSSKENQAVFIPKANAIGIVAKIRENDYLLITCSDLERIELGGDDFGIANVDILTEKLNALENDLNDLKQAFQTWVPTPNDGGAGLKAKTASWASSQITETQITELENEFVKYKK